MQSQILQLDIQGTPQAWISPEQAALHLSTDDVAWAVGESDPLTVLRGGYNARLQRQSSLAIPPIIALRGQARVNLFDVEPTVTRRKLFVRDRFTCAYCGDQSDHRKLQAEHIHPESRGGAYTWLNLVSACKKSPPNFLRIHCVSECARVRRIKNGRFSTRGHYQYGSPVRQLGLPAHSRLC